MKIFATRKKKKPATARTHDKSDPIVEELLKKDPSEWNAKERRMVKRYRDRKAKESSSEEASSEPISMEEKKIEEGDVKDESESEDEIEDDINSEESNEQDEDFNEEINNDDSADSAKDENNSDDTKDESKPVLENTPTLQNEVPNDALDNTSLSVQKIDDGDGSGMVNKHHKIWMLLDTLNSKQKRTYTRKLNRLGLSILDEVEKEVQMILDGTMNSNDKKEPDQSVRSSVVESNINNKHARTENKGGTSTDTLQPNTKKRKKNGTDWSSLPAEERLRREEQRTKQTEAAARRARGEAIAPGHKYPLNSARRRANRRKPKWSNKSTTITEKQEHNSSGYLHRLTDVNNY